MKMSILVDKILSTESSSVHQILKRRVRFILTSILYLILQLWIIRSCLVRWMVFLPMVACCFLQDLSQKKSSDSLVQPVNGSEDYRYRK